MWIMRKLAQNNCVIMYTRYNKSISYQGIACYKLIVEIYTDWYSASRVLMSKNKIHQICTRQDIRRLDVSR